MKVVYNIIYYLCVIIYLLSRITLLFFSYLMICANFTLRVFCAAFECRMGLTMCCYRKLHLLVSSCFQFLFKRNYAKQRD